MKMSDSKRKSILPTPPKIYIKKSEPNVKKRDFQSEIIKTTSSTDSDSFDVTVVSPTSHSMYKIPIGINLDLENLILENFILAVKK